MQSDYISRQEAIDGKISIQRANGVEIYTDEAVPVEYLKNVPAADVVPVVYGKWIRGKYADDDLRYNDYSYCCNRCGKIVGFEENYCPKCGAKMDGGKS